MRGHRQHRQAPSSATSPTALSASPCRTTSFLAAAAARAWESCFGLLSFSDTLCFSLPPSLPPYPNAFILSLNYSPTARCPLSLPFTPTHKTCLRAPLPSLRCHFHVPVSSLSHLCCSFCPALPLSSAGAVRASSIFPILSVILLFMGGLCIAASEFYKTRHNIILSAGIFFVSAGKGMHRA